MFDPSQHEPYWTWSNTSMYVQNFHQYTLVHMDLQDPWTPGTYKELLVEFQLALDKLNSEGVQDVYVLIPEDEKLLKFEKMMGLEHVLTKDGHHVLWRETSR